MLADCRSSGGKTDQARVCNALVPPEPFGRDLEGLAVLAMFKSDDLSDRTLVTLHWFEFAVDQSVRRSEPSSTLRVLPNEFNLDLGAIAEVVVGAIEAKPLAPEVRFLTIAHCPHRTHRGPGCDRPASGWGESPELLELRSEVRMDDHPVLTHAHRRGL
ncbi:hypothetical protein [Microlunatus endophyticus]|uniref:hypothetical protein n=1 Tax=Microlunatus endophyticus TaxID=1716077 RepID=UPI00166D0E05|nr:hypothetical protein [Microlunatus endophyticus]